MKPILLLSLLLLFGCTSTKSVTKTSDQNMRQYAVELAHRFIITDTHIDLPEWLVDRHIRSVKDDLSIVNENLTGDFDFERAIEGGLDAPFMSIYVPSSYQSNLSSAKSYADSLIDLVNGIIKAYPDRVARGDSPEMIDANFKNGLISFPMGLENGAPIMTFDDVNYFYQRGIRYVTLTHAKDNQISDSSYDTTGTWGGLSPFGIKVVERMNKVGMIIDVSHITDQAFYQVMKHSKAPVLATHSSCRAFTPGWQRNMSDDMIKALAKNDGVIQINFGSNFLDAEVAAKRTANEEALRKTLAEAGLKADDPSTKLITETFWSRHSESYSDVKKVADHIDHVRNIAGIDHIGIGSDFDGVGDTLPNGLKDVSMYPNLIEELLQRGYSEDDIEKICYKNTWRVWHKVNQVASAK